MSNNKRIEPEKIDQDIQYLNDEMLFELKGIMWEIYLSMLIKSGSACYDKTVPIFNRVELQNNLEEMERMGLVVKNKDKHELVVDRKHKVILRYLLRKGKSTQIRSVFYISFLITSFLIFLNYIKFIPSEPLTTLYLSSFFSIFSIFAFIIELIMNKNLMSFFKKII